MFNTFKPCRIRIENSFSPIQARARNNHLHQFRAELLLALLNRPRGLHPAPRLGQVHCTCSSLAAYKIYQGKSELYCSVIQTGKPLFSDGMDNVLYPAQSQNWEFVGQHSPKVLQLKALKHSCNQQKLQIGEEEDLR